MLNCVIERHVIKVCLSQPTDKEMCDKYVGRFTNFFALFYKFKYVQMVYVNNTSTNVFGLPVVAKVLS